jgi:hypothetical protein
MSKTQLQKLRDAAMLAYQAAEMVDIKATDKAADLLEKTVDYFMDGATIADIDALIASADEP